MPTNIAKLPSEQLPCLAATIRTSIQAGDQAACEFLEYAFTAGDALIAAKAAVPHGDWLEWLSSECGLGEDRAERYMRLARGREMLEANSARVRNLSLTGALRLLKPPSEPRKPKSSRPQGEACGNTQSVNALTPQDVGHGEVARFRARCEELESEKKRLELRVIELESEIAELRRTRSHVDIATAELAADPLPHPLDIPPSLRRVNPTPKQSTPQAGVAKAIQHATIHDGLFRGFQKLKLEELEDLILSIQRATGHGAHLTPKQWNALDRMRKRAGELRANDRPPIIEGEYRVMA